MRALEWVGLTDQDKQDFCAQDFGGNRLDAMDWAEKRLKEKNTPKAQPDAPAYGQVYRCKIKSRKQIEEEIPREKQGWWADIAAGQMIRLREATQADVDRCTLNAAHSKNPADYMCETFENGSLVSKIALEYMNPEENVFALIPTTESTT